MGLRRAAGHPMKPYALEAPGRTARERDADAALRITGGHLELDRGRG
ncbi:hypothetical protein ACFVT2_18390 [Streptomyces sp. NPDC058000]